MTETAVANRFVRRLVRFFAMGFGAGAMPVAPGTFGTLVAIPIYLLLSMLSAGAYIGVTLLMFGIGVWLCQVAQQDLGEADHPGIVWDEIVGYLVTMFLAPSGWLWIVAGFLLFRLFDIWKPFPIRLLDQRVHGGLGIMLDDALAGIYASVVLQLLIRSGVAG